jgi:DEAD/DEAH box helicase domain-containing protein
MALLSPAPTPDTTPLVRLVATDGARRARLDAAEDLEGLDEPDGIERYVRLLQDDPRAVHVERLPARAARTAELARPLPDSVRSRLGIDAFWSHQAEAIDLLREGCSVAIATGTASGKSLCYQVPIAESIAEGLRPATALLVFPTKALAQDQLRALGAMEIPRLVAATYDGDLTADARTWVRQHANVVLTNPEMLHHGLLPNHARWSTYLMRLRYIVVDELHVLRGIFGTNVAHVLRRLRRVCLHYGSDPTFVFSSATIGAPGRLAAALCADDVVAVTDDGSPRGERLFVLWNPAAATPRTPSAGTGPDEQAVGPAALRVDPPLPEAVGSAWPAPDQFAEYDEITVDHRPPATSTREDDGAIGAPARRRASANRETAALVASLVRDGQRAIAFCRSRKGTEIVAADVGRRLPEALADLVRPYRAGYLTDERREIEADLFSGRLRAVIATSALELGVDIGGLDACVLDGFPGTIASMWQQAGRAGRRAAQSLAILVAGDDQLDQWYMGHPHEVFHRPPEPAVINAANTHVLFPHLVCAAYELPLSHADERWWPELLDDGVSDLVVGDQLRLRTRGRGSVREPIAVWAGRGWPSSGVGLRGGTNTELRIELEDGTLVGTADTGRAARLVHPGAIYVHRGRAYRVLTLDYDECTAVVEEHDGSEYTLPRSETQITILDTDATQTIGAATLSLGTVRARSRVIGYRRIDAGNGELLSIEELHLPAEELETRGFWYTVQPSSFLAAGLDPDTWPGTLHAIEHAAIGIMPLFTICDRWDVGGVSTVHQAETGLPTIVIHDAHAGGAGVAELGYAAAHRHLRATLDVIEACPCETGCPSCVQSPKCGNGNEPLDKAGAAALLAVLLGS